MSMRYYLDFDRTLFDTESYKAWLKQRPEIIPLAALPPEEFLSGVVALANEGALAFAPGELSQFLYPDAAAFLREKENAATIITFGDRKLQELKVMSALHGIPRVAVMYTQGVRKGAYLAPHTHLHGGAVLADDYWVELEILAAECAGIRLFEMRRDGAPGDGRWPAIRSLAELP